MVSAETSCACGSVAFAAAGRPILHVACYCDDCQQAGRAIEERPNAPRVLGPDGGTDFVLYRKDRFEPVRGAQLLELFKLQEKSATKRVIATCCNSAMYLDFEKGHWVSVYRDRLDRDPGPVQMRIQTRFKPADADLSPDVPTYLSFPAKFIATLLKARIAMLFRR